MEGSITNIALRGVRRKWVTPLLSSGCLCGVTRHFLLRKNFIEEDNVTLEQLKPGTKVLLMNAIMGCLVALLLGDGNFFLTQLLFGLFFNIILLYISISNLSTLYFFIIVAHNVQNVW